MRVKGGIVTRRRHKRLLKLAEGLRGRRKNCFKIAKLAVQKALQHAYRGRKQRKRDLRRLWNVRINALARQINLKYSQVIHLLNKNDVALNRKSLAYFATLYPEQTSEFLKSLT